MIFGKIIGGLIGLGAGGLVGALIGIVIGHFFDKSLGQAMGFDYGADRERLQRLFFETSFQLMGALAKSDGRISEEEVAQAETLMSKLGLTSEHRQEAIQCFKDGALPEFDVEASVQRFVAEGGCKHNLPALLLEFLFSMAMADGEMQSEEQALLSRVGAALGMNSRVFDKLLAMLRAQHSFQQGDGQFGGGSGQRGWQQAGSVDALANAYGALGVSESDNDKDIKRAYRKLMSAHHPDKLIAQGVPEDMMKVATEKAQEIQAAYELIKKSRA